MILFANRKYFICPSVTGKLQQAGKEFYYTEKNDQLYRFSDQAAIPSAVKKQGFFSTKFHFWQKPNEFPNPDDKTIFSNHFLQLKRTRLQGKLSVAAFQMRNIRPEKFLFDFRK